MWSMLDHTVILIKIMGEICDLNRVIDCSPIGSFLIRYILDLALCVLGHITVFLLDDWHSWIWRSLSIRIKNLLSFNIVAIGL